MYIESGKDTTFSCTALGGSATTISWTQNGKEYTSGIVGTPVWDEGTHSITSTISITGVDADDDGLYVCRHSGDPSVTDSITLDVYGKFVSIFYLLYFSSNFQDTPNQMEMKLEISCEFVKRTQYMKYCDMENG